MENNITLTITNLHSCLDKQFRLAYLFHRGHKTSTPELVGGPKLWSTTLGIPEQTLWVYYPKLVLLLGLWTWLLREPVADSSGCHTNNMADDEWAVAVCLLGAVNVWPSAEWEERGMNAQQMEQNNWWESWWQKDKGDELNPVITKSFVVPVSPVSCLFNVFYVKIRPCIH